MNRPMRRQKCEVTDPVKIEQIIKKAAWFILGWWMKERHTLFHCIMDIFIRMEDLRYICMAQRKDANMT